MNTCTHKPPPLHPHSISSSFPASPFFTLWGLLKGAWLYFQLGATQGSFPLGSWQEMKAVHIVPDAFQHYASVGRRENHPFPSHMAYPNVCLHEETVKIQAMEDLLKRKAQFHKIWLHAFLFFNWTNFPQPQWPSCSSDDNRPQTKESFSFHFRCMELHPANCSSVNGTLNMTPRDDNTPLGLWQAWLKDDITVFSGGSVKRICS